jgi:hypothetical protein
MSDANQASVIERRCWFFPSATASSVTITTRPAIGHNPVPYSWQSGGPISLAGDIPIRDGFVVLIGYGLKSDWLKNVFAGGQAVLHKRGKSIALANPRLLTKAEAATLVTGPSGVFYRLFPYNEAALVLTKSIPRSDFGR